MFKDLLETPFEYGKMDCVILTQEAFRRYGIEIPLYNEIRQSLSSYNEASEKIDVEVSKWVEITNPKIPCLVAIKTGSSDFVNHVGVYVGNDRFIHITKRIGKVTIERLSNPIYSRRKFYTFNGDN